MSIGRWLPLLLALCFAMPMPAGAQEEDDLFADIPVQPRVVLHEPAEGVGVDAQNRLRVRAEGRNVSHMELTVRWEGGEERYEAAGELLEVEFQLAPIATPITVTVHAYGAVDQRGEVEMASAERVLRTPKEQLIEKMLALALANSKDKRYNFVRAQDSTDPGVCKNFIMRMFDTFKADYRMLAYPELEMHIPLNNLKENCAPYQYGVEWALEGPEDGNPFEVVAKYRYDEGLSETENRALAREMLEQARQGDFYQMAGNYVDGNGPHSLIFIADYDPEQDMLAWTDSNRKGTRVNGNRWGYLLWDTQYTIEWMCDAICHPAWGATLYRLRDDLVYWGQGEE